MATVDGPPNGTAEAKNDAQSSSTTAAAAAAAPHPFFMKISEKSTLPG